MMYSFLEPKRKKPIMETTVAQETNTYNLPKYNLSVLEKRLKSLSRRAKKLGIQVPSYEVLKEYDETVKRDTFGKEVRVRFVEVVIHGPKVQAEGWQFVAAVEHTPAGNAIKKIPGYDGEVPTKYREGAPVCEHCNTNRRRKGSYLCRTEAGEWKQVGRNCLADFLGRDPSTVVWGLGFWGKITACFECDDDCFYGEGGSWYWSFGFEEFLVAVFHFVRILGWKSRSAAYYDYSEISTADKAWWLITPAKGKEQEIKEEELAKIKDEDVEKAKKALEWARKTLEGKGVEGRSDYEQNLYIALSKPGVEQGDTGIVASLSVMYSKAMELELYRQAEAKKSNEWLWTEGERVRNVSLKLVSQKSFESDYGATILHRMEDDKGNLVIWWGSKYIRDSESRKEAEIGDTVIASWGVKKHDTYKDRKQTVVTRPTKITVVI